MMMIYLMINSIKVKEIIYYKYCYCFCVYICICICCLWYIQVFITNIKKNIKLQKEIDKCYTEGTGLKVSCL